MLKRLHYYLCFCLESVDYLWAGMKVCGSMLGVTRQPCFVLKRVHPLGIQEFEHGSLPSHSTDTSWMSNSFLMYKQWNLQYFFYMSTMPLKWVDCAMTNHLFQVVEKHLWWWVGFSLSFFLMLVRWSTVLRLHCWAFSFQAWAQLPSGMLKAIRSENYETTSVGGAPIVIEDFQNVRRVHPQFPWFIYFWTFYWIFSDKSIQSSITLAIAALNIKKSPLGTSTPVFIDSFTVVQRTQQGPSGLGDFNLTKLPSLIVGSQLDQHLHELMNPHVYFTVTLSLQIREVKGKKNQVING